MTSLTTTNSRNCAQFHDYETNAIFLLFKDLVDSRTQVLPMRQQRQSWHRTRAVSSHAATCNQVSRSQSCKILSDVTHQQHQGKGNCQLFFHIRTLYSLQHGNNAIYDLGSYHLSALRPTKTTAEYRHTWRNPCNIHQIQ